MPSPGFGLHRALVIGDLAFGHVVAPRLDHADRAIVLELAGRLLGHRAIVLLLPFGDGKEIAVDIAGRAVLPLVDDRFEAAIDHPLAVERHVGAHLPSCADRSSSSALAASRVALSGYSNQEKTIVSPSFACTAP